MILNTKQLEELEAIHDVVSEFEDAQTGTDTYDDSLDSAFAWRRGMIERAAQNVKKAYGRLFDPKSKETQEGTLVFDAKERKFGRVHLEKGAQKLVYVVNEAEAQPKKAVPAKVAPSPAPSKPAVVTPKKPSKTPKAKPKSVPMPPPPAPSKIKAATPKKPATPAPKQKPIKTVPAPKMDQIFDPVANPNSYIKQHYKLMSNKELAEATGLSEHTIRRKLGEWGLKRKS